MVTVLVVLAALGGAVPLGGAGVLPAAAQDAPTVQVSQNAALGPILADARGLTLYKYTRDDAGSSNCYDACAQRWPPLVVASGDPTGTPDVGGTLAIAMRRDGTRQVTYNGMPLYYFAGDANPGDANGQGVGSVWYVIAPVTRTPQGSMPATSVAPPGDAPMGTNAGYAPAGTGYGAGMGFYSSGGYPMGAYGSGGLGYASDGAGYGYGMAYGAYGGGYGYGMGYAGYAGYGCGCVAYRGAYYSYSAYRGKYSYPAPVAVYIRPVYPVHIVIHHRHHH